MKRQCLAVALLGTAVWLTADLSEAQAFGKRKGGCDSGMAGCATPCGTSYTVSYVEKKVKAYRVKTEVKPVPVKVWKMKTEPEPYKYYVCEMVPDKAKVATCELKTKVEPYDYYVNQMQEVKGTVKVCQYKMVSKKVPVVTYEPKYTPGKQTVWVCKTVCVPVPVTKCVPVYADACGGLCGKRQVKVCCGYETVTCTVMQRQVIREQVTVDVMRCEMVRKETMQDVNVCERIWVDQPTVSYRCVPVLQHGQRTVCYYEHGSKVIDVQVPKMVQKDGVRQVCRWIQVDDVVNQTICTLEPYDTVIQVPVYTPVPVAPCAPAPCYGAVTTGFGGGCCH